MMKNSHFSKDAAVAASQNKKERDYWLNKLSGTPAKTSFSDAYKTSETRDINKRTMRTRTFAFPSEMSAQLLKLSSQSDQRLHILMVTAVMLLLYKYTGSKDIIVGIPVYKQDVEGKLINTVLALRNRVESHLTFKEFLLQVAQTVFEANENQNYPIETLLYKLNLPFPGNDFPLFDTGILLENIHDKHYLDHIKLNMTFLFLRTGEHVEGAVEYNAALYDNALLERLIHHFSNLLQQCLFNLHLHISDLDMLLPEEKHQLIFNFNNKRADFPRDKTVSQLIENQVQSNPGTVAVGFNQEHLNFNLLNRMANRLARLLKDRGITRGSTVGILLDRSPLMMASILAVWKAQGAYIPMETDYPSRRIAAIMKDSNAGILLTQSRHPGSDSLLEESCQEKIIYLDQNKNGHPAVINAGTVVLTNLDLKINTNSLAYIIYTSGSTGKPKGVMVEHIGMMNHIQAKIDDLHITWQSIIAQNASHTFDISVWQFFTAPVLGGKTVIYPHELILEPGRFITRLLADQITILEMVPSYLSVVLDALAERSAVPLPFDFLVVTGESVKPQLVNRWFENYPGIKMVNAYGPSEASDDVTHLIMDKAPVRERIPIGKPIQNLNIYILDKNMDLCPIGLIGEIYVSGVGVGRGYLNNPELTWEQFLFRSYKSYRSYRSYIPQKLYKTGDLGCWLPEGTIDFFGRKDYQVKIRGFRIELGEIESQLNQYPGIKEAVVVDKEEEQKNKYLCAYLTVSSKLEISKIKTYLSGRLPGYMVPQYFVELEKLPLTNNGKIDRKALPEPDTGSDSGMTYITVEMLEELKNERTSTVNMLSEKEHETFFNNTVTLTRREQLAILEYSKQSGKNYYPLSHPQKMIYYTEKKYWGTACENLIYIIRYPGILDRELLEKAINQSLLKNEGLRLRVVEIEKDSTIIPAQYAAAYHEYPLDYYEFSGENGEVSLQQWIDKNNKKPIPLIDNDLFYFAYIKFGEQESGYYIKFHHIVSDGWTTFLITKEIDRTYRALEAGSPPDHHPNASYIRYVLDEQDYLQSSRVKEDIKFWHKKLLPLTREIDLSCTPGDSVGIEGGVCTLAFPAELRVKIHEYCKHHKTSIYKIILAALSIYISKVTLADDFVIGSLNHNRSLDVYKLTAGTFISFVPIRIKINRNTNFRDFLEDLGSDMNYILKNHQGYPFDFLINELREKTSVNPAFFYNVNLIGHPDVEEENFKIEHHFPGCEPLPLSIHINFSNRDIHGILELEWDYQVEQFSLKNIKQIHQTLIDILTVALENPQKKLDQLLGEIILPEESTRDMVILQETGEVEKYLKEYADVKDAAVVVRKNKNGERYLSAFLVSEKKLTEFQLKHYLSSQLPHHMIPSAFARLEKMPLTPDGKVDRNLLESIETKESDKKHGTPLNKMEEKLVEIWGQVLGRPGVGIHENFFMIGGDSIKTIQIASRMNRAGYKVGVKDIFQNPTISQLSPLIKELQRSADQTVVTGVVPLTPVQEEFFQTITINGHHFNQGIMFYSKEGFEKQAVEAVFKALQEHHDALRMIYKEEKGKITQVNQGLDFPLDLRVFDLRSEKDAAALEKKANEIQTGIDLGTGPLMKLGLFHMNDGDRLLVVIHHLVIDGVSWRILLEDIELLYGQYKRGEELVLPSKTNSFKLWAEKLSVYANSKTFLKEIPYWTQLESNIVPEIKKDFQGEDNYVKDTRDLSFDLGEEETGLLLSNVNKAFKTEINDILLTALGLGIRKTFARDRVLIALEGHGREEIMEDIDIGRTVGWFTSVYPVLMDVSYTDDPGRQVKEIKETLRRIPNKGIGYGILKYLTNEENKKKLEFKLSPQISFNYMGQVDTDIKQISFFEIAKEPAGSAQSLQNPRRYDLDINGMTVNNRLTMTISYNKKQFKPETIEALVSHFQSELRHIIAFCCSKENIELTPSDFTYKGLSIESIGRLMELYPGLEDIYTLTPMQEGMLFHALHDDSSYSYFEQVSYRLQGELDIGLVEKSLNELFKRHDILRTVFVYQEVGRPVQVVLRDRVIDFYYQDISKIASREEKENFIKEFKVKDKERSFDLSKDVLMRVSILQASKSEYEFTWSFHHILMDGWCIGILNTEFFEIYTGYLEKHPYRLPGVKSYRTYIQWLEKKDKETPASYWQNYLESFEEQTSVPRTKIIKQKENRYINETVLLELNQEKTILLNQAAAGHHVTLNTVFQTIWGILLGRYNGKEDVVFGAVVSGRPFDLEGVESMVGLFINAIPVRIRFAGEMKFHQLLRVVQEEAIASEPYHYYPLPEIQSGSSLKQNLIDHLFIFENYPIVEHIKEYGRDNVKKKALLKLSHIEVFEQTNYDFNLILGGSNRFAIKFQYNGNLYDRDYVKRIASHFCQIIDQIIDNDQLRIKRLTFLSNQEKSRILYNFNNTELEYPQDKSIHRLFAEQVERTPHRISLVGPSIRVIYESSIDYLQLSYRELYEQSNRLAHLLRQKGARLDTIVGIMTDRSIEMVICLLGILKAEGAYLPIDPQYPGERIHFMLKDSGASILVTAVELLEETRDVRTKDLEILTKVNTSSPPLVSAMAYIIYTSGSAGQPKGVMVEHKNVVNFNQGIISRIAFFPGKAILALTTISFDIFVLETFLPLLNSLKVVIANEDQQRDPGLLGEIIVKHQVDMLQMTPTTLHMLLSSDGDLHCLKGVKELMVGGEAFPDHLFARVQETFKGRIYNMYGPTETTVWSAVKDLTIEETVNIGTPIANTRIFIVDGYNHLLPVGAAGELYIGGGGTARGYLNNPELTYEKFINYKLQITNKKVPKTVPVKRIYHMTYITYKTGDLARWLSNGDIEYLGRIDQQVKVRGFRVELGDIENQLLSRDDIKEAVVVVKEGGSGDKYICAYFIPHAPLPENSLKDTKLSELNEYLAGKLPYYMIPSYLMLLEQIPKTPNGKIDRKALPAPDIKGSEARTPPRNEVEERLVEIWSEILGIEREKLGIDHNFFQVGGHSLKAVVLVSSIHKEFNVKISLAEFFKAPWIRRLAEYIKNAEINRFFSIRSTEKREYFPLSSAQERLFFLAQLEEIGTAYNMSMVLEWQGPIDKAQLESTLQILVSRHESLRTSFHIEDNQPLQRIRKRVEFYIEYYQVEVEAEVKEGEGTRGLAPLPIISSFIRPFDLSRAPLLRVGLIRISEKKHIFITDMHHIVSDGVSIQLLVQDFIRLYSGKGLPPLRLQYRDYSQWQNSGKQKEIMEKQREYWTGEFTGEIPVLQLPIDYPRPMVQSFVGSTLEFELSREQTHELRSLASEIAGTLYMVLLTLYNIFLWKITDQEDIVIGTPVAGRRHKDLEQIIGNFVNTLALRHRPESRKTFQAFLEEVKQQTLQAFDHQEYPYEDLIEEVSVKRDTSRNPLFDTVFVMHNVDIIGKDTDTHMGDAVIKPFSYHNKTTKFDLTLGIIETRDKLFFNLEYCTGLFKSSTIKRFAGYFKEIVRSILESLAIGLGDIEIMPEQEKQQLLSDFNNTKANYPKHKTIHQLFGEQVEKTPDHVSVVFEDKALTYKEVDRKSNHLAHHLRNNFGLKPEEPVGLLMHRSEHVIVSMLATLKAGGVYIPLDPDYPWSRINYLLEDSTVVILVSTVSKVSNVGRVREVIEVNASTWDSPLERTSSSTLTSTCQVSSTNLAYIIYTSGSTGKPKGVLVEHRSVIRLFFHQGCLFDFTRKDIWTMFHSPCFDFSVWEIYGALFYGGKVIVVPKMTAREPAKYLELLKARAVTVLNQTPTAFYSLATEELQYNNKHLHLKYIIFGGETLHPIQLKSWRGKYPGTRLINMFGITETTVHVTYKELSPGEIQQDVRLIGKPIPTLSTAIMNDRLKLLPPGIVGEIYVGGGGVARGYLNRVELTGERFIENPHRPGERLYRSGDLARTIETADLEYLGRMDHQVQLRGFRVELEEIENQLLQHKQIKEVCVIDREDSSGDRYLSAYIVPAGDLEIPGLREYLAGRLPDYMIPSYFVQLPTLPLTANGKINRQALPDPEKRKTADDSVMPRDEVEKNLAKMWSKVLGIDSNVISIDDNFFQLGGHSLKAGVLVAAIHKEMNVKLPVTEVFITPNIRGMAEFIREAKKEKFLSIMPFGKKDYYPLSSAQRRLHIMQQVDPSITAYNVSIVQVVQGKLEKNKLEEAFRQLIKRHESLRTSFEAIEEEPVQKIHEHVEFEIEYDPAADDIEGTGGLAPLSIEPTAPGQQLVTSTIKNFIRPFDLSQVPLLRVGLIEPPHTPAALRGRPSQEVRERKYILMVDMHHIITDGVSANILIRDFAASYEGKSLPGLRLQYKDYSQWQNSEPMKKSIANQKKHWLNLFAGNIPQLDLPIDYPRPENKTFEGDSINFVIGKELSHGLQELSHETGATLFMLLFTVYNILLSRYSRQGDIVVGSPITGRRHADLQHIVGMFVNMLAFRNHPVGNKTFRTFLAEVKQNALQAYENQDYQFEQLIIDLDLQGTKDRNPLFDVVFAMQKIDFRENVPGDFKGIEHLKFTPYPFKKKTTPFDLLMAVFETEDRIEFTLTYSTHLFKPSTAEKISRHYIEILEQVTADMDIELHDIQLSQQMVELESRVILQDEGEFGF